MTAAPDLYVRVDDDQNFPHDALEGCETALNWTILERA